MERYEGADVAVAILRSIRERRGVEAAVAVAAQLVVAGASIIAREHGPAAAEATLDLARFVLPEPRKHLDTTEH